MSATEIKPASYNTEQNVAARLNAHEVWLNTQRAQGEPARFENENLSGISILFRFIFFCLQLHRLWVELAQLPAVFPDGIPLDRKAYPSPWTAFVLIAFRRLVGGHHARGQVFISALITWGIVPFNLLHIWVKYLCCHEEVGTALHILCILLSVAIGMLAFDGCLERLKTHEPMRRPIRRMAPISILALFAALFVLTMGGLRGGPAELYVTQGRFCCQRRQGWSGCPGRHSQTRRVP
jgi:hypothetical protein